MITVNIYHIRIELYLQVYDNRVDLRVEHYTAVLTYCE